MVGASIRACQILDSRGNPTVQVTLTNNHGTYVAAVPSGASKGTYEAHELRDGDPAFFKGQGVQLAVSNVNEILGPKLLSSGIPWTDQTACDALLNKLDGSPDKSRLGANAILAASMVFARAGAGAAGVPLYQHLAKLAGRDNQPFVLPVPCFNVLNGGMHAGNDLAFQEFMLIPSGAKSFEQAYQIGAETYHQLKTVIHEQFGNAGVNVGDEGGFAPPVSNAHEAFQLLQQATKRAGHEGKVKFGLDPASSEFFQDSIYDLGFKSPEHPMRYSPQQLSEHYQELIETFPLVLLEDPFAQDDWDSWSKFPKDKVEIVGDDLLATNPKRIAIAVEKGACNSGLIKVNQIGTVSETIAAVLALYNARWSAFISHRSGETLDDFIADLVVGVGAGHIKSGAPCRGERVAKYNRLLQIEREMKDPIFAGLDFRNTPFKY